MNGTNSQMALISFPPGSRVRIASLDGGRQFRSKMLQLGILPGETVSVVRGGRVMPLVLEVKGTKIMIGRGAAAKIYGTAAA